MTGYHTRWARIGTPDDDLSGSSSARPWPSEKPCTTGASPLGLTVAELALRVGMTSDEIERIEEGGTEPTIALLRTLAAALDADVRLTADHDLGSISDGNCELWDS